MMYKSNITKLKRQIKAIKKKLFDLGEMRPGSISEQYNVCGNPNCACKNKENPKKHGPYYQLSYSRKGKSTTEFIKKEKFQEVSQQLKNYKMFKKLTEEWIDLSIEIAKMKKKAQAEK